MGTEEGAGAEVFCPTDENIERWMDSAFDMVGGGGTDGWLESVNIDFIESFSAVDVLYKIKIALTVHMRNIKI